MAGFDHQVLTDVGWNALADALSGKRLTFTHLSAGDGTVTGGDAQMQGMTSLLHETMDFPITSFSDDGKGQVTLIGTLTNTALPPGSGFYWRELGVICTIDNGPEILYSVSNAGSTADYIPDNGSSPIVETIQIVVKIDRGINPVINVVDIGTVTAQNIGPTTAGAGPFRDKIGSVLNIKRIVGTNSAKVTETSDLITVDVQIPVTIPSGGMIEWAGVVIPTGYLACDGSIKNVTDFPALFAAIGNRWGGNGTTTFGLPDTRSRVAVGAGQGSGTGLSSYVLGAYGGDETIALTSTQLPSHTHTATQAAHTHTVNDPTHGHNIYDPKHAHPIAVMGGNWQQGPTQGLDDTTLGSGENTGASATGIGIYANSTGISLANSTPAITVTATGGGAAHSNIQPYYVVNKIIKI